MPNANVLKQKQEQVAALAEKMKNSAAGVVVDYRGITVADDTKLRRELREAGVEYAVIKNNILRRAAEEAGLGELTAHMVGTTAFAYSPEDPIAAAKILNKFAEASKDKFEIRAGYMDGKVLDKDGEEIDLKQNFDEDDNLGLAPVDMDMDVFDEESVRVDEEISGSFGIENPDDDIFAVDDVDDDSVLDDDTDFADDGE